MREHENGGIDRHGKDLALNSVCVCVWIWPVQVCFPPTIIIEVFPSFHYHTLEVCKIINVLRMLWNTSRQLEHNNFTSSTHSIYRITAGGKAYWYSHRKRSKPTYYTIEPMVQATWSSRGRQYGYLRLSRLLVVRVHLTLREIVHGADRVPDPHTTAPVWTRRGTEPMSAPHTHTHTHIMFTHIQRTWLLYIHTHGSLERRGLCGTD